jgi:hypothetical protein
MATKKKSKRKPRNKIDKSKVDFFLPLDVLSLGGPDDPCFGKLQDISTPECQRCGDSELCSIKMTQTSIKKRAKIEEGQTFKDNEETYILVENYLKGVMEPGRKYDISFVISRIEKKFMMPSAIKAKTLLIKTYKFSGKLKKINKTLLWKP